MRRGVLVICLLLACTYALPASAVTVLSEKDWQTLKSFARSGSLGSAVGASVPVTCTVGELYFDTSIPNSARLLICVATNAWVEVLTSNSTATIGWPTDSTDKMVTWANAFVNALAIGDGNDYWVLYRSAVKGLVFACVVGGVEGACNYVRQLQAGKYFEVQNAAGDPIFRVTNDTNATNYITVDVEGTGNTVTIKDYKYFPFAACVSGVASPIWGLPSSNAPTVSCKGSTLAKGVLEFPDGATDLSTTFEWFLNEDWTGAIDATIVWESTSTSTNNVLWGIAIACAGAGESSDPALTDDDFAVDANNGTANTYNLTSVNTVTTTGSCTANKMMHIRVKRRLSQAGDTLAANAQGVGLSLKLRSAQ